MTVMGKMAMFLLLVCCCCCVSGLLPTCVWYVAELGGVVVKDTPLLFGLKKIMWN